LTSAALAPATRARTALDVFRENRGAIMPIAFIAMLGVLLVRLPLWLMDVLLALNITLSIVVLLTTIFVLTPLEFSVFPSMLLMTTLYRLVLNVATTRLILSNAETNVEAARGAAGNVIRVFGAFVAGGDAVVGFVMFVIIIIIQFVVITKGTTRISEVAARFTLDAMPGKQMAIDADLNSGLITEPEARQRREDISRQADFYGAMDGASKFVRGDAIAGIIITIINIIGGLVIGTIKLGMTIRDAGSVFSVLTVGDGLVSQVPALIVALSAGLLVTRATSRMDLGEEVISQLMVSPRALHITGGFLILMGLATPLPWPPMLGLGGAAIALALIVERGRKAQVLAEETQKAAEPPRPEKVESLLKVDPLELEVGYGLVGLVDGGGGGLLDRITMIRRQIALEMGIVVPPIRIRDNMQLEPNGYLIKVRGVEAARGEAMPEHLLAMDSGAAEGELAGVRTKEPAFGLPAVWIPSQQKQRAEMLGYTVVDATTVIATHMSEVIRSRADELLSREEANKLLNTLRETSPAVVEEVVPNVLSVGIIQKVLQALLRERVSIRNLELIVETLGDYGPKTKDVTILTEYARNALASYICGEYKDERNRICVVTLDPKLEDLINGSVEHTDQGVFLTLAPGAIRKISEAISTQVEKLVAGGHHPIVLCSPQVRAHVKRMASAALPQLVVLSYNEIVRGVEVEAVGMVTYEA